MKYSELTYKEIYGQPVSFQAVNDHLEDIYAVLDQVFAEDYDEVIFTGCGTSLYLAQAAAHAFGSCTAIPAKGMCCSELYYFPEVYVGKGRKVLVVPITRKSYTTEVRMAIDKVRGFAGVKSLSITCDPDSQAYNDYMVLSPDTAEESVIMTRSFTSMVYLAVVLAFYAGGKKGKIQEMEGYGAQSEEFLRATDAMAEKIVKGHPELNLFITLGQGVNYGIANECMNKMKEMGLANSEAYYSLEYRHGPMSLVDEKTLVILLGNEETVEGDAKLLAQMKGYGAVVLAIGNDASKNFDGMDYVLDMPFGYDSLQNAAMIGFIGQLMGYYIAAQKGLDADTPRHLSQAIIIQ